MRIKRRHRPFIRLCCLSTLLIYMFFIFLYGFRSFHNDVKIEKRTDPVVYPEEGLSHNRNDFIQDGPINRCNVDSIRNSTADILTLNTTCQLDVLAASAICRAKSESCKNQITDVACRLYKKNLIPRKLPKLCQREAKHGKGEYLGCYHRRKHFRLFIPLYEDETPSQKTCVEKCLEGGDMYAGPDPSAPRCWCGNTLDMKDRLSETSCDTTCLDSQPSNCSTRYNLKVFSTGEAGEQSIQTQLVTSKDEVRGMNPVRIVFVFTVSGRAVRQIRRLLKTIYHVDHYYYIHVDSRADYLYRELLTLEDIFPNVRLARERLATIWGGASRLQAHFSIMRTLLAMSTWSWDYYINLSETHYPIKTITSLTMYLQKYRGNNFIQMIKTSDPITVKDSKIFVECDEHMWLLGKQELPEGINFYNGYEWICLHRDFVEYAVTGTDPLLTGLKEIYKYTMAAEELTWAEGSQGELIGWDPSRLPSVHTFKHEYLEDHMFCKTWVNEDMHFIRWFREKGCSVREEVDVYGCSPLDIRLQDFQESIVNLDIAPQFWARKFESIVDQEVLNNTDRLLGINYSENRSIHRYWQNEFHFLDKPSSTTDLIKTFAYSFIRRSMQPVQSCGLTDFQLLETHVLNVADKFDSYLVKFSTMNTVHNRSITLECRFSRIQPYTSQGQNSILKRLNTLEVGTHYDKKEEIFRNYPGFFGPHSTEMTLQYSWIEGLGGNVIFTLVDPSGKKVSILEKHIETEASKGAEKLVSNSTLQTGVWKILVQSDSKEIAELQFLVLPLLVSAGPSTGKDVKQNLLERIDELSAQFWRAEGLCSLENIWSQCTNIEQCTDSEWSSMSPDPKSDITMIDNEIKTSK